VRPMPHRTRTLGSKVSRLLPLVILLLLTGAACKKKIAPAAAPTPPPVEQKNTTNPMKEEEVKEAPIQPIVEPKEQETDIDDTVRRQNQNKEFLKTVYFDFDKSEIKEDQVAVLRSNAAWLKANPKFKLLIEGHCDERDTIEYNLALGDRRAKRVLEYLTDLGVAADRMRKISYGEERPVDPGHDEEAWAKNRRAEFVLEK
jgi:peptidoglycan-associated lipoprotein